MIKTTDEAKVTYKELLGQGFSDEQILAYLEDGQAMADAGLSDQEMVEALHDLLSKKIAAEKNKIYSKLIDKKVKIFFIK